MLHDQPRLRVHPRGTQQQPSGYVSVMAYRSVASVAPSAADLDSLLRSAQLRNRREGVTGLLIYDRGSFFQWLEGPAQGLARVWDSIRRDPRHQQVKVLREQTLPRRFFQAWDMRLARRPRAPLASRLATVDEPGELLRELSAPPAVLTDCGWDDLFARSVLPTVTAAHLRTRLAPLSPGGSGAAAEYLHPVAARSSTPGIWHAADGAGSELAALLHAVDATGVAPYIDRLISEGASLESLYQEVFEPAARGLGRLNDSDELNELQVTLGLSRLQTEVRRVSPHFAATAGVPQCRHSVLVAPLPGEPHGLGAAMTSELFWRDGWQVNCEYPASPEALSALVRDRWYDVIDLTLSAAARRSPQLQAMTEAICDVHNASRNPALAVIVDGRAFHERPQAYAEVGADAGCATVLEAVPTALRLLEAIAERLRYSRLRRRA